MDITFLGVGEACDEHYPNTSICLKRVSDGGIPCSVLLECGFTVPPLYWRSTANPDELDALWISHFHGDHFFGTPALLLRFWERKREKPLVIVGPAGVERVITQAMELAYPGFTQKLIYPIRFLEALPDHSLQCAGLQWRFALNMHGQTSLAVRLDSEAHSVFYSGDGLFTKETVALAHGCDLAIHEAFRFAGHTAGHGTVRECINFAHEAQVKMLALVHMQRDERRERLGDILAFIGEVKDREVLFPEPGHVVTLE